MGYWDWNKPEDDNGSSELHFGVAYCGMIDGKDCDVLGIRDSDLY